MNVTREKFYHTSLLTYQSPALIANLLTIAYDCIRIVFCQQFKAGSVDVDVPNLANERDPKEILINGW